MEHCQVFKKDKLLFQIYFDFGTGRSIRQNSSSSRRPIDRSDFVSDFASRSRRTGRLQGRSDRRKNGRLQSII